MVVCLQGGREGMCEPRGWLEWQGMEMAECQEMKSGLLTKVTSARFVPSSELIISGDPEPP